MGKHTLFLEEAIVRRQAVIDQYTNLAEVPLHLEEIVKDEYENKSGLRSTDIDKYPGLQVQTSKFGKLTPFLRRYLDPEAFGNLNLSIFGAMIGLPYHFRYLSTNELDADWRNFLSYLQKNGLSPNGVEESKNFKLNDETKFVFVVPIEQKRAIIQKQIQKLEIMPYLFYDGAAASACAGLGVSLANLLTNNFKLKFDSAPFSFCVSCAICGLLL